MTVKNPELKTIKPKNCQATIPESFYFYWTGNDFRYVNYLAVISLLSKNKSSSVKIYFDKAPRENGHWDKLVQLGKSQDVNLIFIKTNYKNLIRDAGYKPKDFKNFFKISKANHKSDLIRYLLIYNYGGIYLDFDVVVIKSLNELRNNYFFVGFQFDKKRDKHEFINGAVMGGVKKTSALKAIIDSVIQSSDKKSKLNWADIGPKLLSSMVTRDCSTTIYSHKYFYCVPWDQWQNIFSENKNMAPVTLPKEAVLIHFWHALSKAVTHQIDENYILKDDSLYSTIAREYVCQSF